ncbi:pentapeptide repeat-containing protein, partial [Bacillus cereus]
ADLNLSSSTFNLVTLGGVQFKNTSLGDEKEPLSFENCDLEGSTMHNSNLKNIEIVNCDVTGMKINGIPIENLLELYNKVKI